jgi:hypothetical protein
MNNRTLLTKKYYTHTLNQFGSSSMFGLFGLGLILYIYNSINEALSLINETFYVKLSFLYQFISIFLIYGILFLVIFIQFGDYNFSYLLLSDDGIEYKNLFYKINANWDDIIKIYRPLLGQLKFVLIDVDHDEYLELSNSEIQSPLLFICWFSNYVKLSKRIPISRFAWNWRSSELGEIIFTHKPNLYTYKRDY